MGQSADSLEPAPHSLGYLFFVVPAVTIAGAVSAWLTITLELNVFPPVLLDEIVFTAVTSAVFGLAMAFPLRVFRVFQTWVEFLGFTATVIGAHVLQKILDSHFPEQVRPCWDCSPEGSFLWDVALRFFFVSLIVLTSELILLRARPHVAWLLAVAVGCSSMGAAAIGFLDSWAQWHHMDLVFNGMPLWDEWQTIMACTVGVGAWSSGLMRWQLSKKVTDVDGPNSH